MADLFDTTSIKTMTMSNRFVRSATWSGMATEDGKVTPKLTTLMANLAKGGVGLIVLNAASRGMGIFVCLCGFLYRRFDS